MRDEWKQEADAFVAWDREKFGLPSFMYEEGSQTRFRNLIVDGRWKAWQARATKAEEKTRA